MRIAPHHGLLACILMPIAPLASAQDCNGGRYTSQSTFPNVTVTQAVVFGSNTGVNGQPQTLRLDVYEPAGDVLDQRPVMIVAFGGSFITGTRADVAPLCQAFARMGYVAVAPDYRVGFFLPNEVTTTRAVMRGAHDMKACVRFLRKTVAEQGNPYKIDPDRIIIGGVSAGAISALHATYLDQDEEIPAILQGESAALGGVEGNSGSPGYSSEVFAMYSFSGALGDTLWIEPGDKPLVSIHETGDNVVPYYTQQVSVIGIPTGLTASGSHDIHLRMNSLGLDNCLKSITANAHVGYIQNDQANSLHYVASFTAKLICDVPVDCIPGSVGLDEMAVVEASLPYPNPSTGLVWLELPQAGTLSVLDLGGREVWQGWHPGRLAPLDLAMLSDGVYQILARDGSAPAARIVIAR